MAKNMGGIIEKVQKIGEKCKYVGEKDKILHAQQRPGLRPRAAQLARLSPVIGSEYRIRTFIIRYQFGTNLDISSLYFV